MALNLSVTIVLRLSCSYLLVVAMEVISGTWHFWKGLDLGGDPGQVENGGWGQWCSEAGKPESVG